MCPSSTRSCVKWWLKIVSLQRSIVREMPRCVCRTPWTATENEHSTGCLSHTMTIPSLKLQRSLFVECFKASWGKHVWKTKDFLIAADMNELSETTAVSRDYITRHANRMQSLLIKRQSQRRLLLLPKKKIPGPECLIPVPAGYDNHMFTEPN